MSLRNASERAQEWRKYTAVPFPGSSCFRFLTWMPLSLHLRKPIQTPHILAASSYCAKCSLKAAADVQSSKMCSVMQWPHSCHLLSLGVLTLHELIWAAHNNSQPKPSLHITSQFSKTHHRQSLSHSECCVRHLRICKIKELIIRMGNANATSEYIIFMEN